MTDIKYKLAIMMKKRTTEQEGVNNGDFRHRKSSLSGVINNDPHIKLKRILISNDRQVTFRGSFTIL